MTKRNSAAENPPRPPFDINIVNSNIFENYIRFLAFLVKFTVSDLFGVTLKHVKVIFRYSLDKLIYRWIKSVKSYFDPFNEFKFAPNMDSVNRIGLITFIMKLIDLRPNPFDRVISTLVNCSTDELKMILYALISRELKMSSELKSVILNSITTRVFSGYSDLLNDKVSIALFSSNKDMVEFDYGKLNDNLNVIINDVFKMKSEIRDARRNAFKSFRGDKDKLQNKIESISNKIRNKYGCKVSYFCEMSALGRHKFKVSKLELLEDSVRNKRINRVTSLQNLRGDLNKSAINIYNQIISFLDSFDFNSVLSKYSSLVDYLELNDVTINYGMVKSLFVNGGIFIPSPLITLEVPFDLTNLISYVKFTPYSKDAHKKSFKDFVESIKSLDENEREEYQSFLRNHDNFMSNIHVVRDDITSKVLDRFYVPRHVIKGKYIVMVNL